MKITMPKARRRKNPQPQRGADWFRIIRVRAKRENALWFFVVPNDGPDKGEKPWTVVGDRKKAWKFKALGVDEVAKTIRAENPAAVVEVVRLRPRSERGRPTGLVMTCHEIWEDVEPGGLPAIPKGTMGVLVERERGLDYVLVNFGAPWGTQLLGNHDIVDASAVLRNGVGRIKEARRRSWESVIRNLRRTFAAPYLVLAAWDAGFHGSFNVEAFINAYKKGGRLGAIALITRAIWFAERGHGPRREETK